LLISTLNVVSLVEHRNNMKLKHV